MIYIDAYSVFAGERHPLLFGSKVREGWPEVADFNDNVMKVGLGGGTISTATKNSRFTVTFPEPVWMNLDYSPVLENGRPAGVLAVVVGTTQRVLAKRALAKAEKRLRQALNASGMVGTFELACVHSPIPSFRMLALQKCSRSTLPKATRAHLWQSTLRVSISKMRSGSLAQSTIPSPPEKSIIQEYRLLRKDGSIRWVEARGECLYGKDSKPARFIGCAAKPTDPCSENPPKTEPRKPNKLRKWFGKN